MARRGRGSWWGDGQWSGRLRARYLVMPYWAWGWWVLVVGSWVHIRLTHCMCAMQESRPTWGDGQWSGRLRAKMLGDALLSMRMMSNGCRLISSYSLTHCMLAVQESKKAGPPLMKEEAWSIAPNPAGAPYTSYTSNMLVLNCPPRISPQSLLACMLGEMNWPTNVTPNSLCLYVAYLVVTPNSPGMLNVRKDHWWRRKHEAALEA